MKSKKDNLKSLLDDLAEQGITVHVILLCETYITNYNQNFCNINSYQLHFKSRHNSHGGGVAVFVRNDLTAKIIDTSDFYVEKDCEIIALEINVGKEKILCVEIYHSPNRNHNKFVNCLGALLESVTKTWSTVIIAGDFNYNLLNQKHKATEQVFDIFVDNRFLPLITIPTRVTHSSCTLIDNIYLFNNTKASLSDQTYSSVILDDMSDHFPCFVSIPTFFTNNNNHIEIEYRPCTKEKIQNVRDILNAHNWSEIFDLGANDCYNYLVNAVTDALDKVVPIKTDSKPAERVCNNPWYTKSIAKCKRKSKQLYLKSLRDPNVAHKYRMYRNSLKSYNFVREKELLCKKI